MWALTRFSKWPYEVRQREAARAVGEEEGWMLSRIKGSHHIFTKEGKPERVVIPIHGNESLKIGLLRSLMKIIPVAEDEL